MHTSRRNVLIAVAGIPALMLVGCSKTDTGENVIDPAKVRDGIKNACGIAVVLSSIASILKLDPTLSIAAIIGMICDGYKAAKESGKLNLGASGAPLAGSKFHVDVKGKPVEVELE